MGIKMGIKENAGKENNVIPHTIGWTYFFSKSKVRGLFPKRH